MKTLLTIISLLAGYIYYDAWTEAGFVGMIIITIILALILAMNLAIDWIANNLP